MSAVVTPLVAGPVDGDAFEAERRVELSDVDPMGRMRLDALARVVQDVAAEDSERSPAYAGCVWVVRRSVFDIERFPGYREVVGMRTWCGGVGSRWAERRVSLVGNRGARVEASALWVLLDPDGAPRRLPDELTELLLGHAGGRKVSARLQLDSAVPDHCPRRAWPLRRADVDLMGHVNNAVTWAAVEDDLAGVPRVPPEPLRAEMEYLREVLPSEDLSVVISSTEQERRWWLCAADGVRAVARLTPGPGL